MPYFRLDDSLIRNLMASPIFARAWCRVFTAHSHCSRCQRAFSEFLVATHHRPAKWACAGQMASRPYLVHRLTGEIAYRLGGSGKEMSATAPLLSLPGIVGTNQMLRRCVNKCGRLSRLPRLFSCRWRSKMVRFEPGSVRHTQRAGRRETAVKRLIVPISRRA